MQAVTVLAKPLCQSCKMINFTREQYLLCDLFAEVYKKRVDDFSNLIYLISNKRFNSSNFWSSTTNASDTSNAWNVNFNNGNDNWNDKANTNFVRCVRPSDNRHV